MVSNVARLTRSVRDSVYEQQAASPAPTTLGIAEKLRTIREELSESGHAIFTDERGNRFRIERKPA